MACGGLRGCGSLLCPLVPSRAFVRPPLPRDVLPRKSLINLSIMFFCGPPSKQLLCFIRLSYSLKMWDCLRRPMFPLCRFILACLRIEKFSSTPAHYFISAKQLCPQSSEAHRTSKVSSSSSTIHLAGHSTKPNPTEYHTQIDEGANKSQYSTTTNYDLCFQKIGAEGHANQHNGPEYQNGFVPGLKSYYGEVIAQDHVKQQNGAHTMIFEQAVRVMHVGRG